MRHCELKVSTSDLINCLSNTIDLVSPNLADHHKRVGRIAFDLACQFGLTEEERIDLLFAGNLHDIGAFFLKDRLCLLAFEDSNAYTSVHAEIGAFLLEMFSPLTRLSELVRFHHVMWDGGTGKNKRGREVPLGSHILHLADRISVLFGKRDDINPLVNVPDIINKIEEASGSIFAPVLVEAFNDLSCRESFWLGIAIPGQDREFEKIRNIRALELDTEGVLGLSRMFSCIIDFRSRFTATHSSGVAASAETLAHLAGRPLEECGQMRIAGLLHDLGKLIVPAELLEKPDNLSSEERTLLRCHTYFTRRALEHIDSFETITDWGANHHERIDGQGYPYHIKGGDLSENSRIMAVADIFTAITEDRPYRAGMKRAAAKQVLRDMAAQTAIDADIVELLISNFDELNYIRVNAQTEAVREYEEIRGKVAELV